MWIAWTGIGGLLLAGALGLQLASGYFGPRVDLADMPARTLAAGLMAAGLVYLLLALLIPRSVRAGLGEDRRLVWLVVGLGFALRMALFGSTPAMEDDWNRYLWDGAVTAHGMSPYAVSPDEAQTERFHYTLQPLARQSGTVIERINHSELKTIYPPVTQLFFAAAHVLSPWSLEAWRIVSLAAEAATLLLLLKLLSATGQSPLWVALYWWNPVIIKELMNSAHMESVVTPFVLAALLLTIRSRPLAATASLGFAVGAKVWPLILAPLVLRPLLASPVRLALAALLLAGMCILWAAPILAGGLDETSGFVVYVQYWRNSSAHFGALQSVVAALVGESPSAAQAAGLITRGLLAATAAAVALALALRPIAGAADLLVRAGLTTGALFLLSPSQFPWYAAWMLPFVVFRPWLGLLAVTALIPIYYVSFHYEALDEFEFYRDRVVWLIWLPVWALLAAELRHVWSKGAPWIRVERGRAHA